jgi:hypothetical protein
MTGPEHYREAEKLLSWTESKERGSAEDVSLLTEALARAVLALAAATALGPYEPGSTARGPWIQAVHGMPSDD